MSREFQMVGADNGMLACQSESIEGYYSWQSIDCKQCL